MLKRLWNALSFLWFSAIIGLYVFTSIAGSAKISLEAVLWVLFLASIPFIIGLVVSAIFNYTIKG